MIAYVMGSVLLYPAHDGYIIPEVYCMKQKYVPLNKRSKKKQKEYHEMQRRGWGEFSPVTRKTVNQKTYNRKKPERWHEHEPSSGFLFFGNFMPALPLFLRLPLSFALLTRNEPAVHHGYMPMCQKCLLSLHTQPEY